MNQKSYQSKSSRILCRNFGIQTTSSYKNIYKIYMGGGFHKPGSRSYMAEHGFTSKYDRPSLPQRSPTPQRSSPSPPRRSLTQADINEYKAANERARVHAIWNSIERNANKKKREALIQKKKLANEAKRVASLIKQQNRLAAAAAVNVKNVNKIFKNNKTILGRLRRLAGRLSR
jgi:hypothetical protein